MQHYSKEQQLQIGQEIYSGLYTVASAASQYKVNYYTARGYLRLYKAENGIIDDNFESNNDKKDLKRIITKKNNPTYEDLKDMNKEELINEVIKARVSEERAKKGYEVKGGGRQKEYVILSNKIMK